MEPTHHNTAEIDDNQPDMNFSANIVMAQTRDELPWLSSQDNKDKTNLI
jgi:hypothetical protein